MSEKEWISNIWDSECRLLERYLPEGSSFGASQNTDVSGLTGVYIVPGTDMTNFWEQRTKLRGN